MWGTLMSLSMYRNKGKAFRLQVQMLFTKDCPSLHNQQEWVEHNTIEKRNPVEPCSAQILSWPMQRAFFIIKKNIVLYVTAVRFMCCCLFTCLVPFFSIWHTSSTLPANCRASKSPPGIKENAQATQTSKVVRHHVCRVEISWNISHPFQFFNESKVVLNVNVGFISIVCLIFSIMKSRQYQTSRMIFDQNIWAVHKRF